MIIRELEMEDALFMLEWMHDDYIVHDLQTDFSSKTLEDCYSFIIAAKHDINNIHLAVANEENEYMGTVSLKNISDDSAEFAITIRASAMGKGYSKWAMDEILRKGFDELGLSLIYWCVSPENKRAVRFYDKNGYERILPENLEICGYSEDQINAYLWYYIRVPEN